MACVGARAIDHDVHARGGRRPLHVEARVIVPHDVGPQAESGGVVEQCRMLPVERVGFGGDARRRRGGVDPPVVVHAGHANHVPRPAAGPQEDVPILGAVGLAAEAADLVDDAAPHQVEVREVVDRKQDLGAPLGLEQCVLAERRVFVDAVLVGVEEVSLRIGGDRLGHPRECEGGEFVVVVKQGDEVALGHRECGIGVGRDAAVGVEKRDAEPRIAGRPLLEQATVVEIVGGGTGQAGFPVTKGLGGERLERPDQEPGFHAIHGDQHADQRSPGGGVVAGVRPLPLPVTGHLLRNDPGGILGG